MTTDSSKYGEYQKKKKGRRKERLIQGLPKRIGEFNHKRTALPAVFFCRVAFLRDRTHSGRDLHYMRFLQFFSLVTFLRRIILGSLLYLKLKLCSSYVAYVYFFAFSWLHAWAILCFRLRPYTCVTFTEFLLEGALLNEAPVRKLILLTPAETMVARFWKKKRVIIIIIIIIIIINNIIRVKK
jgi:hypothetical protein